MEKNVILHRICDEFCKRYQSQSYPTVFHLKKYLTISNVNFSTPIFRGIVCDSRLTLFMSSPTI